MNEEHFVMQLSVLNPSLVQNIATGRIYFRLNGETGNKRNTNERLQFNDFPREFYEHGLGDCSRFISRKFMIFSHRT